MDYSVGGGRGGLPSNASRRFIQETRTSRHFLISTIISLILNSGNASVSTPSGGDFCRSDEATGTLSGSIVDHVPCTIKLRSSCLNSMRSRISDRLVSSSPETYRVEKVLSHCSLIRASILAVSIRPSSNRTFKIFQIASCIIASSLAHSITRRPISISCRAAILGEKDCSGLRGIIGGLWGRPFGI
jgi:hypothetical protein